jgi:ribosome-associated protein
MFSSMPVTSRPPRIPDDELEFRATRAGGPGGQHVNTSSTRVEVRWNVETSRQLGPAQRARLRLKLGSRIDAEGWLRVVAADTRSQTRNREAAVERLRGLVERALAVPRPRRPTRVPAAERHRRLETKRRRGATKRDRRRIQDDE